jgi:uncharacterized protein YbcV (DUF1398 family)
MFTLEQISAAHSKVTSGADFPRYIQDIAKLGVAGYETFVTDGHTVFKGNDNTSIISKPKYSALVISDTSNTTLFKQELKKHQQGKTDYLTFCSTCADTGIEKWVVDIKKTTCTYYTKAGVAVLTEIIPTV